MFGRKSEGFVQMYEYGRRNEPVTVLDEALDQMARRVRLWNRFVQIETEVRRKTRLLLDDQAEQRGTLGLPVFAVLLLHGERQTSKTALRLKISEN
jgi:hypothetical protein